MSGSLPKHYHLPLRVPPCFEGKSHYLHVAHPIEDFSNDVPVFMVDFYEVRRMFGIRCVKPANPKNVLCDDAVLSLYKGLRYSCFFVVCGTFIGDGDAAVNDGYVFVTSVFDNRASAIADAIERRDTDVHFGISRTFEVWRVCGRYSPELREWNRMLRLSQLPDGSVVRCEGCLEYEERSRMSWEVNYSDDKGSLVPLCPDCFEFYCTDGNGDTLDMQPCACCGKMFRWSRLFRHDIDGMDARFCLRCVVLYGSQPEFTEDKYLPLHGYLLSHPAFYEYPECDREEALSLLRDIESLRQLREAGSLGGDE